MYDSDSDCSRRNVTKSSRTAHLPKFDNVSALLASGGELLSEMNTQELGVDNIYI